MSEQLPPIHPGEHLAEFLEEHGLSQYRAARDMSIPPRRLNEIVQGNRGISADTALRLARYFGTTPQFWMNLQDRYEVETAQAALGDRLEQEVRPLGG